MPEIQRGDVWLVDLGLAAKVRPCLVLSVPAADQDRALVTMVAHTTNWAHFPPHNLPQWKQWYGRGLVFNLFSGLGSGHMPQSGARLAVIRAQNRTCRGPMENALYNLPLFQEHP